jgi:hypothetical protein
MRWFLKEKRPANGSDYSLSAYSMRAKPLRRSRKESHSSQAFRMLLCRRWDPERDVRWLRCFPWRLRFSAEPGLRVGNVGRPTEFCARIAATVLSEISAASARSAVSLCPRPRQASQLNDRRSRLCEFRRRDLRLRFRRISLFPHHSIREAASGGGIMQSIVRRRAG